MELYEGIAAVLQRFHLTRRTGPTRFDYAVAMRPDGADLLAFERR